jgi:hypothetical protein
MFDTLVRFIKIGLRTILVLGLVVAAAAFLTGPSVTAVRTRAAFASGLARARRSGEHAGLSTGPVGKWTYAHRHGLRISAVALIALIFVFWGRPTAAVVIVLAIVLLVILGLIELIGRPPAQPTAPETAASHDADCLQVPDGVAALRFPVGRQVIATASADFKLTLLTMLVVVVINVLLVWLPITLHLVAAKVTERRLTGFNGWLRANGSTVLVGAFAAVGGGPNRSGDCGLVSGAR